MVRRRQALSVRAAVAAALTEYRLFFLDGAGRICRVEALASHDDDEAIRMAWREVGDWSLELWSPGGLVARFSARA